MYGSHLAWNECYQFTIHTTYIHTLVTFIDMNNTRVNCKLIFYGVCQVYAEAY